VNGEERIDIQIQLNGSSEKAFRDLTGVI